MAPPATVPPSRGHHDVARAHLDRADVALERARGCRDDAERYVHAHVAALRTAAAVLAVRARPHSMRHQHNAWVLLGHVAPELGEWAAFFAAGAAKRAAAEAGRTSAVTTREADDLVRDVETFVGVVERLLGLSRQPALPDTRSRHHPVGHAS